ncbi:MAG: hypothetical protein FMNOHCHN_03489 [Ignavibacteriaceae bacterium]|nr:hypothetical protein [Ignavibacteriaceae bacterium]
MIQSSAPSNLVSFVFSEIKKTFAVVSPELGHAMIFMGNPHGFNRGKTVKTKEKNKFLAILAKNGYKELDGAE